MVGTARYMAPEVMHARPHTFKCDLWALGCVLYEMCALRPAFGGDNYPAIVINVRRQATGCRVADVQRCVLRLLQTSLFVAWDACTCKTCARRPVSAGCTYAVFVMLCTVLCVGLQRAGFQLWQLLHC